MISDLFGSLTIVAFVVRSVWLWVLLIPKCLASGAASGVARQCSAVQTRSINWHCLCLGKWFAQLFLWVGQRLVIGN